jgi:hypothetical protein
MQVRSLRRVAALSMIIAAPVAARAQSADDSAAVRRTSLDYIEGFYEGDSTKLARAVRPEVFKYGFSRDSTGYHGMQMAYPAFFAYAARVKASGRPAPATAPKKVELLDLLDQTAAVKVTAWWGTDYMLLAKYDGRWMISHVLWQSPMRR